jgi:hypothetical protein
LPAGAVLTGAKPSTLAGYSIRSDEFQPLGAATYWPLNYRFLEVAAHPEVRYLKGSGNIEKSGLTKDQEMNSDEM